MRLVFHCTQLPPLKNMEDSSDYDIEKDIPTIEELEKLGERAAVSYRSGY